MLNAGLVSIVEAMSTWIRYQRARSVLFGVNEMKNNLSLEVVIVVAVGDGGSSRIGVCSIACGVELVLVWSS